MDGPIIVFANGGPDVGLGHIVRCTALVQQLQKQSVDAELWTPPSETSSKFFDAYDIVPTPCRHTDLQSRIERDDPPTVVLDSYDLTTTDVGEINDLTTTVVIDELGNRRLPVDLVINNNVYADQIEYPDADRVLRGPSYCMLREEFRNLSSQSVGSDLTEGSDLLLTIGGSDLKNSFKSILETTTEAVSEATTVHAIVGPYFDSSLQVDGVELHRTPSNMSSLMASCDFAISGGGQTLYELAVCGTPPVAVRLGDDQVRNITRFEEEGFCIDAGWSDDSQFDACLTDGLQTVERPDRRDQMARIGQSLVDGKGTIRVADQLLEMCN